VLKYRQSSCAILVFVDTLVDEPEYLATFKQGGITYEIKRANHPKSNSHA
jgi:hypothetical protein